MANRPDIDIDFKTTFHPTHIFDEAIPASIVRNGELVKHTCGYYFQNIPIDSVSSLAAIPYEEAEILGFQKFDFLHLSLLDTFKTKSEIRDLLKKTPDWNLLLDPNIVSTLFQLHKNHSLLVKVKPQSVQELADCIALIRPNKKHLLDSYLKNKEKVRPMLYRQGNDDKSSFRKSHAIAYSLTIVLQLNQYKYKQT